MTLGLIRRGVVRLVPYSASWAEEFRREQQRLLGAIGDRVSKIEHVGSTAIPGIHAKPVLDIAVAIQDLAQASSLRGPMQQLGYDFPGDIGIPGERIFGRGPELLTHLVHVVEAGGTKWAEYLNFRDSLRTNVDLAREYDRLKLELACQFPDERAKYTEGKRSFIRRVVEAA